MDAWNTFSFPIGGNFGLFSGANLLLVSGRVYQEPTYAPKQNHQIIQDQPGHFKTSNVPWSFGCRVLLGMAVFPLLYGNNGTLDPGTKVQCLSPKKGVTF